MPAKTEVDYLAELVEFPTITGDFAEAKKCAEYCADFFRKHGMHTEIIESEGFPNVFATTQKTKKPKVLLQAHMDVVPANIEFFKLKRIGDKIFGRGVHDMKFAGACYLALIDRLSNKLKEYDFGVFLSFDEEVGGGNGVESMLNEGYGGDICILPDSGTNWSLEPTAHGAWWMSITSRGKSAHASRPESGVNAAQILVNSVSKILATGWGIDKDNLSVSLTRLNCGSAVNQIPDNAEAAFDVRFREHSAYELIEKKIAAICSAEELEISTLKLVAPTDIRLTNSINDFVNITEKVIGRKVPISHSYGATDGRFFSEKAIPCVIIQPNGGDHHGDGEWIEAADLPKFTEILYRYILKTASI